MENKHSNAESVEHSVKEILRCIGENPERAGLKDTPSRIARMFNEIFRGYDEEQKPKITVFDNDEDGSGTSDIIVDSGEYYSMCEHHMMPFFGKYMFAYIPAVDGKIIGLSKIARVVDYCSARLQVQERLCKDIVSMIEDALSDNNGKPLGIAMIMEGQHLCKTMRGVKKNGKMVSIYAKGVLDTPEKRKELLSLFSNLK